MNGDMMIDKRTREVFNPEVDFTHQNDKFQADFMVDIKLHIVWWTIFIV